MTGTSSSGVMDYYAACSMGIVPGTTFVGGLGNNPSIDTGTVPEDIWSGGGQFPWITTAAALEAVSTSANENMGSIGAFS